MTDVAGPFDGTPWAEAQWARHAANWAPSGVYGAPAASTTTGDLPLSVSGLSVGLGAGRAGVRGFGFERTGAAVMQTVTANTHASFFRRDRIVLRRNLATHTITPVLITGTPSGAQAAPAITQSETGSWDLPMFSFLVPPASGTGITGVVDERGWIDPTSGTLSFPSTAARDAHIPAPINGAVCWCVTPGSFFDGIGGAWVARPQGAFNDAAIDGSAVPATARIVRVRKTVNTTVTNGAGGFNVDFGVTFTKLMSCSLTAGSTASGLAYITPVAENHSTTQGNGVARTTSGVVANSLPIRVEVDAVGYI